MSIEITPAMMAELEDKAKAATPGPWYAHNTPSGNMIEGTNCEWVMGSNSPCNNCKLTQGFSPKDFDILGEIDAVSIPEEDLHYIAAASPDVVLALISELRKYMASVQQYELRCPKTGLECHSAGIFPKGCKLCGESLKDNTNANA